jgi:2',3'-cyclic-nucleotide 2'-phosphodiesterase (5'-nucleotidase family)
LGQIVGSYPHFSNGISIEYDHKKPIGSRVTKATLNHQLIKEDDVFTIASTCYLLDGGDGFHPWKNYQSVEHELNEKIILHDVLLNYIKKIKIIDYYARDFRLYEKKKFNMWQGIQERIQE